MSLRGRVRQRMSPPVLTRTDGSAPFNKDVGDGEIEALVAVRATGSALLRTAVLFAGFAAVVWAVEVTDLGLWFAVPGFVGVAIGIEPVWRLWAGRSRGAWKAVFGGGPEAAMVAGVTADEILLWDLDDGFRLVSRAGRDGLKVLDAVGWHPHAERVVLFGLRRESPRWIRLRREAGDPVAILVSDWWAGSVDEWVEALS